MVSRRPRLGQETALTLLALALVASGCTNAVEERGSSAHGDRRSLRRDPNLQARPRGAPFASACSLPEHEMLAVYRGYHPHRSPDLYLIPRPPNYFGSASNWTHSGPWRYLQNVPLVFYGPGVVRAAGPVAVPGGATLADVAPTLSSVLPIDWPARRSGNMIDGVFARSETGAASPRLVSILVWDGVGDNVLSAWPRSWPYLSRLMRGGVSVTNATAGSSP